MTDDKTYTDDDLIKLEGATPVSETETHFRVWAPLQKHVSVEFDQPQENGTTRVSRFPLKREPGGWYSGIVPNCPAGTGYSYRFMNDARRPDPRSRLQQTTVHDRSVVVDPSFAWKDGDWKGISKSELIIYEMHIGTFSDEGTFNAAIGRLNELVELGITSIELLPVCQTPGRWNWGYDGAQLFAVRNTYGGPQGLKRFVDACHKLKLAVIMDVVYNHLGPEGNYIPEFAPYFSRKHHTPWGPGLNYDGPMKEHVRQYVIDNACYWIDEYHCDGLRLDAIHYMFDDSDIPITMSIRDAISEKEKQLGRTLHLIGESNLYDDALLNPPESQTASAGVHAGKGLTQFSAEKRTDSKLQPSAENGSDPLSSESEVTNRERFPASGRGYDAIWADDFMHALYSIVTDAKMTKRPYHGAKEVAEALQHGFLYEGPDLKRTEREHPLAPPTDRSHLGSLVVGIQTHDMIGNHPHGSRLAQIAGNDVQRAAIALALLYPAIPILFMGEEFASPSSFHFFVDFGDPHLQKVIAEARSREHPQHIWNDTVSPIEPAAFERSKLPPASAGDDQMLAWYRALIALRKKWQSDQLLIADHLSVSFHEATSTILLSYQSSAQRVFVASLICDPQSKTKSVELKIDGEILLDSMSAEFGNKSKSFMLSKNHAVIGTGEVSIMD